MVPRYELQLALWKARPLGAIQIEATRVLTRKHPKGHKAHFFERIVVQEEKLATHLTIQIVRNRFGRLSPKQKASRARTPQLRPFHRVQFVGADRYNQKTATSQ